LLMIYTKVWTLATRNYDNNLNELNIYRINSLYIADALCIFFYRPYNGAFLNTN